MANNIEEKVFLRELDVLGKPIGCINYSGTCTGLFIICENGVGFVAIFCMNKKREKAILRYDVINKKASFLSLEQVEELINKIGNEKDKELRFNKDVDFEGIKETISINKEKIVDRGYIDVNNTKIYIDKEAQMLDVSVKMIFDKKEYPIEKLTGALFEDFSCKYILGENQLDEKIKKASLLKEIYLYFKLSGTEYVEKGNIYKIERHNNQYHFNLMSYSMYMLGHIGVNNLIFQGIRDPFVIIKYLLESTDIDITGVEIPNELNAERDFLVAMAVENMRISDGGFFIGDVRIGEEIKLNPEFEKLIEKEKTDECVIVWTYQRAKNHYEAYSLAKNKITKVVDLISFLSRNDCLREYFGLGEILELWDESRLLPEIRMMNIGYIEDCLDRQIICISGDKIIEPHILELKKADYDHLEVDWVEQSYTKCLQEKDKKIESLFNAMRWINKVKMTGNHSDNIIYCVTALEFCLYEESGDSYFEKLVIDSGYKENNINDMIIRNMSVKIERDGLENVDEDYLEKLETDINVYLIQKMKESDFMSKLKKIIDRLNIPMTDDEMNLIILFRKKRNKMIHGHGMFEINESSVKKMVGIVSRIITYKLMEVQGENGQ